MPYTLLDISVTQQIFDNKGAKSTTLVACNCLTKHGKLRADYKMWKGDKYYKS
jgi:hypothetical protein